ncbi:hypothetical protein [Halorarum salinum]|uniref:Uncharacterized protein n=1 Tax=Halorarum salinum TaxID=2743089 RepID=A0A7D5QCF9_9EURY|nr:hypothetical protein [Halobaculum salinum]QLG63318.1 hypothetical protein HUG12_16905 [Halobaculum salinum]
MQRDFINALHRRFRNLIRRRLPFQVTERHKVGLLALISLLTHEFEMFAVFGLLSSNLLFFYTIYLFAGKVLHILPAVIPTSSLQAILAGTSLAFSALFGGIHPSAPHIENLSQLEVLFPTIMVSIVVIDTYFVHFRQDDAYPHQYGLHLVAMLKRRPIADVKHEYAVAEHALRGTVSWWWEVIETLLFRGVVPLTIITPFLIVGVFLPVIGFYYPLPELALLGGVLVGPYIASRFRAVDSSDGIIAAIDSESVIVEIVSSPRIHNFKGYFALAAVLANFIYPALMVLAATSVLIGTFSLIGGTSVLQLLTLSVAGVLVVFGIYGAWFWRIELCRLPAFVTAWEQTHGLSEEGFDANAARHLKTRPRWGMLPASVYLLIFPFIAWLSQLASTSAESYAVLLVYAIFWVGGGLFLFWSLRWTQTHPPQSPYSESRTIMVNCIIQSAGVAVFFTAVTWQVDGLTLALHIGGVIFILPLCCAILLYFEDASMWIRRQFDYEPEFVLASTLLVNLGALTLAWWESAGQVFLIGLFTSSLLLGILLVVQWRWRKVKARHMPEETVRGKKQ